MMKIETFQLNRKPIIPNQNLGIILTIGFSVSVVIHVGAIAGIVHSWQPNSETDEPMEITLVESVPLEPVSSSPVTPNLLPKAQPVAPKEIEIKPISISVKPLPPSPTTSLIKPKTTPVEHPFQPPHHPAFTKSVIPVPKSKSSSVIKSIPQVKTPNRQQHILPHPLVPATIVATPFPTLGNPASIPQPIDPSIVKSKPIAHQSTSPSSPLKSQPASTPIVSKSISPAAKSAPIISSLPVTQPAPIPIDPNSTQPSARSQPIQSNQHHNDRQNPADLNTGLPNIAIDRGANSTAIDRQNSLGAGDPNGLNLLNNRDKDLGGENHSSSQNDRQPIGNSSTQISGNNSNSVTTNASDRQTSSSKTGGGLQCLENCQLPKLKDLQANDSGKDRLRIRIEVDPNGSIRAASIATSSGNPQIDAIVLAGIEKMKFSPPGKMVKGIVRINIFL
jgi:TonB family protein